MDKNTKHLILRELVANSVRRNENMRSAIVLGIVNFKDYQDQIESVVKREVNLINHLTEKKHDDRK